MKMVLRCLGFFSNNSSRFFLSSIDFVFGIVLSVFCLIFRLIFIVSFRIFIIFVLY